MTYGEFAWKDHMRSALKDRRRQHQHRNVFVAGEPVPFMEAGERDWSWLVHRAVKTVQARPHLSFRVTSFVRGGRRFGIDDLCKPVVDVVAPEAATLWAEVAFDEKPGVLIADVAPPFPPRIERNLDVGADPVEEHRERLAEQIGAARPLGGDGPVGAHITLGRLRFADLGYRSPIRLLFDALSPLLGGTLGHPGDVRIRELRVVRDPGRAAGAGVRLWRMD